MWCMRRIARISWKEKVTTEEVLEHFNTNSEAEETEVLWPHKTQRRHHPNNRRRKNGGQKTERETKADLVQQHSTMDRKGSPEMDCRGYRSSSPVECHYNSTPSLDMTLPGILLSNKF